MATDTDLLFHMKTLELRMAAYCGCSLAAADAKALAAALPFVD